MAAQEDGAQRERHASIRKSKSQRNRSPAYATQRLEEQSHPDPVAQKSRANAHKEAHQE